MQPEKEVKIPGLIASAQISSGGALHIPKAVMSHFLLKQGDILEFYSAITDFPDGLVERYELIGVVVKRKSEELPRTDFPEPIGKQLLRVSKE